jgi:hypothetical protein
MARDDVATVPERICELHESRALQQLIDWPDTSAEEHILGNHARALLRCQNCVLSLIDSECDFSQKASHKQKRFLTN